MKTTHVAEVAKTHEKLRRTELLASSATIGWAALLAVIVAAVSPSVLRSETLWELRPYRVRIDVFNDGSPVWTARRMEGVVESLKQSARRTYGSQWELTVEASGGLPQGKDIDGSFDKAISLTLSETENGFVAQAVEKDRASQVSGPPADVRFALLNQTNSAAFQAVAAAFSPVARITEVDGNRVHLRVRGSGLPTRDRRLAPFSAGSVARVAVVRQNSDGRELEWTILVVETSNESEVTGRVVSRFENPLSQAGDVSDLVALQISAPSSSTQVRLVSQQQPEGIAGLEVVAAGPNDEGMKYLGRSTSDGTIRVPAGKSRVRNLHVRAGGQTIAQLPIVPGWRPQVVATLSTEVETVEALGGIAAARARLIDLVTRREVAMARAAAREAANQVQQAAALREELRASLKDEAAQLKQFVEQQRERAEPTDSAQRDRLDKSWDDLLAAIDQETDPGRVD